MYDFETPIKYTELGIFTGYSSTLQDPSVNENYWLLIHSKLIIKLIFSWLKYLVFGIINVSLKSFKLQYLYCVSVNKNI